MAVQLGPGGRGFLVAVGIGTLAVAAVRAGWVPAVPADEPAPAPPKDEKAWVWHAADECERAPRVAVPPRAAAVRLGADVRPVPVPHGAAALDFLARGEVDAAVASVAEIAHAWPVAEGARIDRVLGGGRDLAIVAAAPTEARALGSRSVAAPAGSAEAFLVEAAVGSKVQEVDGAREALAQLGAGRAAAAALPRWQLGPAGPVGRPVEVRARMPVDPVVLLVAGGTPCEAEGGDARTALEAHYGPLAVEDTPAVPAELVIAWAAARQGRAALPPLELVATPALAASIWGLPAAPPPAGIVPAAIAPAEESR